MQSKQHIDLMGMPEEMLIKIGLFAGASAMAAMAVSCKKGQETFTANQKTIERHTDYQIELAQIAHHVLRGNETIVLNMLEAAKKNGMLKQLVEAKTITTYRKNHTIEEASLLQIALWSLDERMVKLFESKSESDSQPYMTPEQIAAQKAEMFNDNPPKFVRDFGVHVNVTELQSSWTNLHTYAETLNDKWGTIKNGSEEDLELQKLYAKVIEEQAKLPPHFSQETINPAQPFYVKGKVTDFDTIKKFIRFNQFVDDKKQVVSGNPLKPNSKFGQTYGILRGLGSAKRGNVSEIGTFAKPGKTGLSLTQTTENGLNALINKRLNWFNKTTKQCHVTATAKSTNVAMLTEPSESAIISCSG